MWGIFRTFQFICIAPFTIKIIARCFTETETQSLNPQVSTKTGRNLEQNQAYKEKPRC